MYFTEVSTTKILKHRKLPILVVVLKSSKNDIIFRFLFYVIICFQTCDVFDFGDYPNLWQWYQRTKSAMAGFGYDEIEEEGAGAYARYYKSKLKEIS